MHKKKFLNWHYLITLYVFTSYFIHFIIKLKPLFSFAISYYPIISTKLVFKLGNNNTLHQKPQQPSKYSNYLTLLTLLQKLPHMYTVPAKNHLLSAIEATTHRKPLTVLPTSEDHAGGNTKCDYDAEGTAQILMMAARSFGTLVLCINRVISQPHESP
jgi:hypothetical protein